MGNLLCGSPTETTLADCLCIDEIGALQLRLDELAILLGNPGLAHEHDNFPWWIVAVGFGAGGTLGGAVAVNAVKKWRADKTLALIGGGEEDV